MPCCSCLSESFSNPPLSRAGLSLPLQAHSPQQLATGPPLGGENGHWGAIWRRLEAATANLEQLGGTKMSARSLLNKHNGFIYTFLCTWNKQTQKSLFCCLWMFYFFMLHNKVISCMWFYVCANERRQINNLLLTHLKGKELTLDSIRSFQDFGIELKGSFPKEKSMPLS